MNATSRLPRLATLLAGWGGALALVFGALHLQTSSAGETTFMIPPAAADDTASAGGMQTAVFAGGCFWGVQGVFQRVQGVSQAVSGYAGGKASTAKYEMVTSGMTGHAESVKITYDPKKVSFAKLLHIYFSVVHDPTQLNRQGPDVGSHYRSAVFYADAAQKATTEKYIAQLDATKIYRSKIVTQVVPLSEFFSAEAYHQDYLTLNPTQPYIVHHDLPKIVALKNVFPQEYRAEPALVMAKAAKSQ